MIEIVTAKRSKNGLHVKYRVDGKEHFTDFFYNSINFYKLEKAVGEMFVKRLFFHIVAFDVCKFVAKKPPRIMWGPFFDYVTPSFVDFWERNTGVTLLTSSMHTYPPTSVKTNGTAPLTINGTESPTFTVSGRSRKAKDNHHHVQIKTSLKKENDLLTLFLSLPVATNYEISQVHMDELGNVPYIQTALTPDITTF